MDRETTAWAGGLFEGEGHVGRGTKGGVVATVGMTDLDAIVRFRRSVGFGKITGPVEREGFKPMWFWRVSSFENVQATVAMLWPWLGRRRRVAALHTLHAERTGTWTDLTDELEDAHYDSGLLDEVEFLNAHHQWRKDMR